MSTEDTDVEPIEAEQTESNEQGSLISALPFELLASILAQVALDSPRRFVRTLLIGRPFWIPHNSALLWEPICRQIYPELEHGGIDVDEYDGYYNLFRLRPAVRFNGVYVCMSRYFRDGEPWEGTITFNKPRHEVRYYRYFWLYENGSASSLLCNHPPKQVLGIDGSTNQNLLKDKMDGIWKLNHVTKELKIEVDGGSKRNNDFHFLMTIASSGGKVHNKLKWRKYWCVEHQSGIVAEFNAINEGSYYFHKLAR